MKINDSCLPCMVNQVVKVADMTNSPDRELLFQTVFGYLSTVPYSQKTMPEVIGMVFEILKEHTKNPDPYLDIRAHYNQMLLPMTDTFWQKIESMPDPFAQAVKYAIIGNIIDFSPGHNYSMEDIMGWFDDSDNLPFTIDHLEKMKSDIKESKRLLYLGDNCGEICLDKLLIKQIKKLNPDIHIDFGVRGKPIVNDSIEEDAYFVGIDAYADIVSNGDGSQGTVLERTSEQFRQVYQDADMIIAKGQANYESLSEDINKNIFFLLIAKCAIIADDIGVDLKSLICMTSLL